MINPYFHKQSSSKNRCPRCNKHINWDIRKCIVCKGIVCRMDDDILIQRCIERKDSFYIWHPQMGGWVYQDYFLGGYRESKY